jgi:sigma-B regulation protein RsbU (phosphoserine phosphatase)
LSYVNAGHNPSILRNTKGEIQLLELGCTILGMFENIPYIASGEVDVEPDSVIVNYTDGLSEAMNNEGKLFELEGLINFTHQHHSLALTDFNTKLIERVITFKQDTDFDDDITLLTLRFK